MNESALHTARYPYFSAKRNCSHEYLLPKVLQIMGELALPIERRRVFDLGCGNGSVPAFLAGQQYRVYGVDSSEDAVRLAQLHYPDVDIQLGSAYEDLRSRFGTFPIVLSLEVVEHLYSPQTFARTVRSLLEPGGTAIISTPYHGYWKNLALALLGQGDRHYNPLLEGGHIKFWSPRSLAALLTDAGFRELRFCRVGRIRPVAKSLIAVAKV